MIYEKVCTRQQKRSCKIKAKEHLRKGESIFDRFSISNSCNFGIF
jgi:hypothetical protein